MAEKNSLWKNIREKGEQNRRTGAKPKKPTTEMIRQERKIKAKKADGGEMPLGLPLKEQNPFLVPEYNQPIANGYILPDPNRPRLLPDVNASEYKDSHNVNGRKVQVPSIVSGQYLGEPDKSLYRYMISGEEFKPMTDPDSYSKFYDTIEPLGLMKDTRTYAEGGYYPTQGPGKALFKGYAEGGYTNPYNMYQKDPYLNYESGGPFTNGTYANEEGVILGPVKNKDGTYTVPTNAAGEPVVNLPERVEIKSDWEGSAPNPYSPVTGEEFLSSGFNPVNWFMPSVDTEEPIIDPRTGKFLPASGKVNLSYPEKVMLPASLPFKPQTWLGKAALLYAEMKNPLTGIRGIKSNNNIDNLISKENITKTELFPKESGSFLDYPKYKMLLPDDPKIKQAAEITERRIGFDTPEQLEKRIENAKKDVKDVVDINKKWVFNEGKLKEALKKEEKQWDEFTILNEEHNKLLDAKQIGSRKHRVDTIARRLEIANNIDFYRNPANYDPDDSQFINKVIQEHDANPAKYKKDLQDQISNYEKQIQEKGDSYFIGQEDLSLNEFNKKLSDLDFKIDEITSKKNNIHVKNQAIFNNVFDDRFEKKLDALYKEAGIPRPANTKIPTHIINNRSQILFPNSGQDLSPFNFSKHELDAIFDNTSYGFNDGFNSISKGDFPSRVSYWEEEMPDIVKYNPFVFTKPKTWFQKRQELFPQNPRIHKQVVNTFRPLDPLLGTVGHEDWHSYQGIMNWANKLFTDFDPKYNYFTNHKRNPLSLKFAEHQVEPTVSIGGVINDDTWASGAKELGADLQKARIQLIKDLKNAHSMTTDEAVQHLKDNHEYYSEHLINSGNLDKFFKPDTPMETKKELINQLPVTIGAIATGAGALYQSQQNNQQQQQAAGGYTMKNNNQSWRNYFQYAAGGPYNEEVFSESPFNNDKKRNTVLSNPLNEGNTYFKPATDRAFNWANDPEYVTRLNENFPDRSKVTKLDTVFKSKQEARQDKRDTNLEGFANYIPTLVNDIKDTRFLYSSNPNTNDQLYRDYSSLYTPEDTAEVKKQLDENPQAFTDPYGNAVVRNRASDPGQAGAMSAGEHEIWHQVKIPASKVDMFGNRDYETLDKAYAGKFATPHPSTWIPNSKGILKSPDKKEFYPMLMQIRMDNGFQPGEIIDDARLNQIRKSGSTNPLFKYYNNEQLKKYLNTFASNIPQSNPQEPYIQKAAQGGYINPYSQYANGGYMYGNGGRTWKNIGAGAFGLLEGVVDTTFGWIPGVDMATDLAYKGLQKLGKSTDDEIREQDSIAGYAQTAGAVGSAILTGGATTGTAIAEGAQGLGQGISKGNETSDVARGIGTGLNIAGGIVGAAYGSTKGAKEAKSAFKLSEAGSQGIGKFAASAPISGFSAAPKGTMQGVIDGNAVSMKPGTDAALSSVTPTASIGTFSSPDITNINAPNPVNKIADVTSAISDVPKSQEPPPMAPPVAVPQVPPPTPQVDYNQFQINPPAFNTGVETPDFNYKPSFPTYSQGGNITNNSLNLRNTMRYKRFAQGGTFDQYGINMIPESAGLHHQSAYGGVPIGPDALAEGGEIKMDTGDGGQYIVSDQVDGAGTQKDFTFSKGGKYKELNRTLADGMKQDLSKYTMGNLATNPKDKENLRRPFVDTYAQSTIEQIKQKWQQKTEYARKRSQQEQVIAQAEEQKRMAEEQFIGAYGGKVSRKNYPNLNRAKGGYVHNQMTQPMLATGGPVYGDPASPYTYAYGGMYGDPYYRGGQIDYTNDMYSSYAGGGPMVGNAPQAFKGYAAQNRGGMLMNYADGGMMPSPEQQMMQEQQMQQAPQEQMPQQGGQEQMMQMVQQVMQALMQGANPEEIMQQLVQSGIPPEQAQQIIQVAMQEAQSQQQQQPMQGEQQMMQPQQAMAQGGMMPQQEGVATQIAEQLQQGADPQQVLESLVQKGMPQQQAMAMLKAIMGQLKNQMQQQPQQQMMPQEQMAPQPMMAARGGYFNNRKQYDNGGFSPLADESTMSQIAGLGQAVVPAVTSAYAFNNLSKRKLNPSLVENVKVDYSPERVALREEGRRGISMALDTMKRNAPTSASFMGNAGLAVLKGNKLVGSQISKSLQDEKNKQAEYDYNIGSANAGIRNKVNETNEEMYQNAMQSGFQAAGQGVKNVASYYGDLENRKLQRWQAMNTSGEDWHWTHKGKAFRNKDGKWYINGKEVDPSSGNPI